MGAQGFYQITLESLGENSTANERLWFKTNLKLCGLWFRTQEYSRATRTLKELHRQALHPRLPLPQEIRVSLHPCLLRACGSGPEKARHVRWAWGTTQQAQMSSVDTSR